LLMLVQLTHTWEPTSDSRVVPFIKPFAGKALRKIKFKKVSESEQPTVRIRYEKVF
jgi:hypothetical protein